MQLHLCGAGEGWYDVDEKDTRSLWVEAGRSFYNSMRIVILMVMVSFDREVIMTSCFLSISMIDNKMGVIHQIFIGDKTVTWR